MVRYNGVVIARETTTSLGLTRRAALIGDCESGSATQRKQREEKQGAAAYSGERRKLVHGLAAEM